MGTQLESVRRHVAAAKSREGRLYKAVTEHAYRSIRFGSEVTGAPGQPVDTGNLVASWRLELRGKRVASMFSPLPYASIIEDNWRGAQFRNHGPHSVEMTRLAWQRIVDYELLHLDEKQDPNNDVPSAMPIVTAGWNRGASGRFSHRHSAQLGIGVPKTGGKPRVTNAP